MLHLKVIMDQLELQGQNVQIVLYKNGEQYDTIGDNTNNNQIFLNLTNDHWQVSHDGGKTFRDATS